MNNLDKQIERIWDETDVAYNRATSDAERRRIIERYNRASRTYGRYVDNITATATYRNADRNTYMANRGRGVQAALGAARVARDNIQFSRNVYMGNANQ